MRACQQCGQPIENNVKSCAACGAEQRETVGFLKQSADGGANVPIGEAPRPPEIVERLEQKDFDPGKAAWLCVAALALVCLLVSMWSPIGGLVLAIVCGLMAVLIMIVT